MGTSKPDNHWGHKNVILRRHSRKARIPTRPIGGAWPRNQMPVRLGHGACGGRLTQGGLAVFTDRRRRYEMIRTLSGAISRSAHLTTCGRRCATCPTDCRDAGATRGRSSSARLDAWGS